VTEGTLVLRLDRLAAPPHDSAERAWILPIAGDRVVYPGTGAALTVLDLAAGELRTTALAGFLPVAHAGDAHRLVCREQSSRSFFLVDLEAESADPLVGVEGRIDDFTFVPAHEALIYSRIRPRSLAERSDIRVYSIGSQQDRILVTDRRMMSSVLLPA
jgi:hypothetical protein